jgi:CheY-like chemotaxis protein
VSLVLVRNSHLLLVEDNEINLQVAQELLEQVNVRISIAQNGKEALEMVKRERFDGILMDLHMPVMDGYTATREIRSGSAQQDIPILAMTARAMRGDREKCIEAGMNDHIAKPIKPADLYKTLIRWLKPDAVMTPSNYATAEPETDPGDDFPLLDGIDVNLGLSHVNGNQKLYKKVLKDVYTRFSDIIERIQVELDQGNQYAAERLVHTFKGLTGTMGARELQKRTLDLENALGKKEIYLIPDLMISFAEELKKVMTALENLFCEKRISQINEAQNEPQNDKKTVSLDLEKMENVFKTLSDLIDEGNTDALQQVKEIRQLQCSDWIKEEIQKLEAQIDEYDFEEARETLNRIQYSCLPDSPGKKICTPKRK